MHTLLTSRAKAEEVLKGFVRAEKQRRGVRTLSGDDFYPVKPRAVAKYLGWNVDVTDGVVGYEGTGFSVIGSVQSDSADKLIRVSSHGTSEAERSFTIAHEIAHIVLGHSSSECHFRFRSARRVLSGEQKRREAEADAFAASLLMPERAVRARFKRQFGTEFLFHRSRRLARFRVDTASGRDSAVRDVANQLGKVVHSDAKSLCQFFGVSATAMGLRLLELELVV